MQVSTKNMRGLMLVALISSVLCIVMYTCNAETPSTTENPELLIQTVRYMSRARRAAQGGGGGGGAGGGAGADMSFGFGVNMGGQAGGQADGQGGY